MLNRELLKKTMAIVKYKPEQHDQHDWVMLDEESPCGTTMCFAGHAAVLAGAEIPDPKKHRIENWYVGPNGEYINADQRFGYDAVYGLGVGEYAANALGLPSVEADYLFNPDREVEDIEVAVEELLEHGQILTYVDRDYDDDDGSYDECPCCVDPWDDDED